MSEKNPFYLSSPKPSDREALENLTMAGSWDSKQFKEVMVALATLGNGQSVPAMHRPETIQLQAWRGYFEDLLERTKKTGNEHARSVLVDVEKQSIIMSGKITMGDQFTTLVDYSLQPGRERFQKIIGTIHTHPSYGNFAFYAHGLSGEDYGVLLSDKEQQFMAMTYGESIRMLALKTSVTPNNLSIESTKRRLSDLCSEFFDNKKYSMEDLVKFNKTVCLEFGLTFYQADKKSNDLFNRINVTE